MRIFKTIRNIIFITAMLSAAVGAQTTTFSYQGSLQSGGVAASGSHDFEFALFDAASGGAQQGSTVTQNGVAVTNGIFAVSLDFGNQFPGASRFLEIRVRPTSGGAFTPLTPRQPVASTPYAIKSTSSDTAATATNATQLGGVAANQYVVTTDPRMTDARPPTPGSGNYVQNQNAGAQASSNFNVSGTGTATVFNAVTQYNIGGNRMLANAGTNNLFAGMGAGANNSGTDNSFFGHVAGLTNTSGGANSFFGSNAGLSNSSGRDNSFFGGAAGLSNTEGNFNSFFGRSAGGANTTGTFNSFFGRLAGALNTTGDANSFFGSNAGAVNTTGFSNAFFGGAAGLANSTGFDNSFFGRFAGASNTTGDANSFFGSNAGASTTEGVDNSFFGGAAGFANSTGNFNSFFGRSAGGANTSGESNSMFGTLAGTANTIGNFNAFFGYRSGLVNTSGSSNTIIGYDAGDSTTTGGGNTFVGRSAGETNMTGEFNTALGFNTGVGTGLSYATAIGSDAVVSASNTIVLGRSNGDDTVRIPGRLALLTLGTAGSTSLCRNGLITGPQISTCSSSLRYKDNIRSFGLGLDLIRQLKPITFDWKQDGIHDLGLAAEDVAAIEPLLATYDEKGQVEGVKYDRIGVVLINAVKEQQTQISGQRSVVSGQQKQIEDQQKQIKTKQRQIEELKKLVCSQNSTAGICQP